MFLCDGAKIGFSRAAGLTIFAPMHAIDISKADATGRSQLCEQK